MKRCLITKSILLTCLFLLCFRIPVFADNTANTGKTGKSISVEIPVRCEAKNTDEEFVYKLETNNTEHQVILNNSIALKGGESDYFLIEYKSPGEYHYTLTQTKGEDKKTKYDTTVYNVDVYITVTEAGTFESTVSVYRTGNSRKEAEALFVNEKETEKNTDSGNRDQNNGSQNGNQNTDRMQTGDIRIFGFAVLMGMMLVILIVLPKTKKERQ